MNASGIERILNLFANDILRIDYDVEGSTINQSVFTTTVNGNNITIKFDVPVGDIGVIDNITIVGNTQNYDTVTTTFDKVTNDIATIKIPYSMELI